MLAPPDGHAGPCQTRAGIGGRHPTPPHGPAPTTAGRAGAAALLFPVFLLLAACLAALSSRGPLDPEPAAPSTSTPAAPRPARPDPAGDGLSSLADLERLRPLLGSVGQPGGVDEPASPAVWRARVAVRDLFDAGTAADRVRPERLAFLYRLAQVLDILAPDGITLEITTDRVSDPATAPARLAAVVRHLVDLGAPAGALRVRSRRGDGPTAADDAAVDFALAPVTRQD